MTRLDRVACDQATPGAQHDPARWAGLCNNFTALEDLLVTRCMASGWETGAEDGEQALLEEELLCSRAPPIVTGHQLFIGLRDTRRSLPTGCTGIDNLIGNGVLEGCVLEVAGASSTGKTQLCHSMAAHTAARGEGCIYIDTTNSFSTQRLSQMLGPGVQVEPVLECVSVLHVHSIHQLLAVLDQLGLQLSEQTAAEQQPGAGAPVQLSTGMSSAPQAAGSGSACAADDSSRRSPKLFTTKPAVLIVDSISAVISPILGSSQHSQGHVVMLSAARALKALADMHNLVVIMTNHVTAGKGAGETWGDGPAPAQSAPRQLVPALGEGWRPQPHMRLQLHLGADPSAPRVATLTHTSVRAPGDSIQFRITSAGLEG